MIQDGIPISTLERAVSTDIVTAEEMLARSMVEALRSRARDAVMGGLPTLQTYTHISEGLFLQLSLGVPVMSVGVLAQDVAANPPDVPAAGSFDSDYRFGLNLATATLTDPWDTTSAWWLLQARVVQVATLVENRDIFNPALGTFAPGGPFDKRYENQVETAWKKGTATSIPAADVGYAALGALYRPAGGGAIADDDVVQLSLQISDLVPLKSDEFVCQATKKRFHNENGADTPDFSLVGEIDGVRLYAHSETGIQIRNASFVDPAYIAQIAQDGYWWYLYLAKGPTDRMPSNLYGSDLDHRGVLVATRVWPTDEGRNSAQFTVPDPLGGVVAAGDGVHVGYFRADGGTTFIRAIDVSSNGDGLVDATEFEQGAGGFPMTQANTYQNGAHNLAVTGPGGTEDVPYGCTLKCFMESVVLDVTAVGLAANVQWTGFTLGLSHRSLGSFRNLHKYLFEIKPSGGSLALTLVVSAVDTNMAGIVWNAANVALNEHKAGLYGISF